MTFITRVLELARTIPRGRVTTYGRLAEAAGRPWASRGVSMILHARDRVDGLPWHRVVRSGGRIKFPPGSALYALQCERLRQDGVRVLGGRVDLGRYGPASSPTPGLKSGRVPRLFA